MTPQQQDIAIYEAMGWEIQMLSTYQEVYPAGRQGSHGMFQPLLPITLDVMHEVEKTLMEEQRVEYIAQLWHAHGKYGDKSEPKNYWNSCCATISQRKEAFLRTIGKWKE